MADISFTGSGGRTLLSFTTAPVRAVWNGLIALSEASAKSREAEYLMSLTDEELKARGLRRDQIAPRVFRDVYYV